MNRNSLSGSGLNVPFALFVIVLGVLWCGVFVTAEFSSVPFAGMRGFGYVAVQWLMVSVCTTALLALLAVSRRVFAVLFPPLTLLSAMIAYCHASLGVGLTATSIEIALVNGMDMWGTVISPLLVVVALSALVVSVAIAVFRYRCVKLTFRAGVWWAVASCAVISLPTLFVPRIRGAVASRMPYAVYYAASEYLTNRSEVATERHTFDETEVIASPDAPDVIVVLGESLRADHLPMNGYGRNTMPLLSADTAVLSFSSVYSEPTHTYTSLPLMLTRADEHTQELGYNEQSFISIFKKAGYSTAWFANQDIVSSYAYFAHEADTTVYCNAARSGYSYGKWLDSDLIGPVAGWLRQTEGPLMAVIHTIGSHWWYKSHYTDSQAVFLPDTDNKDVALMGRQEIVNAYDNSIIATDAFLHDLFGLLRDRDAIVIFISDHGEALGENGVYLHAAETPELHKPACLVRATQIYSSKYPGRIAALRGNVRKPVTTSAIFHTVLDAAGISTPVMNPEKSLMYGN